MKKAIIIILSVFLPIVPYLAVCLEIHAKFD